MSDEYHVTVTIGANPHAGGRASYGSGRYMATARMLSDRGDARARGMAAAGSKERAAGKAVQELLRAIRLQHREDALAEKADRRRKEKHQRALPLSGGREKLDA